MIPTLNLMYDVSSSYRFLNFWVTTPKNHHVVRTGVAVQTGSKPDEADAVIYRGADKPYIVIECKRGNIDEHKDRKQLNGYFCVLGGTKFAVLTNGVRYLFMGKQKKSMKKG